MYSNDLYNVFEFEKYDFNSTLSVILIKAYVCQKHIILIIIFFLIQNAHQLQKKSNDIKNICKICISKKLNFTESHNELIAHTHKKMFLT